MPDFDAGHVFFTALFPLHTEPCRAFSGVLTSPAHALREVLASLPPGQHSAAAAASGRNSPFARSRRTHFARFCLVDDLAYDGRPPRDAIVVAATGVDLLQPGPQDHLDRPYLLFCADFDARDGSVAAVDAWLDELWATMRPELCAIFEHCEAFGDRVASGASADFCAYVRTGQIDTTLPFNAYALESAPSPPIGLEAAVVGGVAAAAALLGLTRVPGGGSLVWIWALAAGLAAAAMWTVARILVVGARSTPGSGADLITVLKALEVQGRFTAFAIAQQTVPPQALHEAFGAWLDHTRPDDLTIPTQAPGVVVFAAAP